MRVNQTPPGVAMSEKRPLHRLFGMAWKDFFQDRAFAVEREKDLSHKQQLIDFVLTRKGSEPLSRPLPDGFEDLADYNLLTFKSYQEALDAWALCELIGHYVNFRKQARTSMADLLPETDFRLFAVCVRYPHNLAQQVPLTPIREGVYEVQVLTLRIRVIVVHQLPQEEQNAMLLLFSDRKDLLKYSKEHYQPRSNETSTLLYQLFKTYSEDPNMAEELKEFVRETLDELFQSMPLEELRKRLSTEQRLAGLSPEERLQGLSPEEQRAVLELLQRRFQPNGPSEKPQ